MVVPKKEEYRNKEDSFGRLERCNTFNYLKGDSLLKLFSSISNERDYLLIRILYELGCTLRELVNIRIRDVDFNENKILIRKFNSRNKEDRSARISRITLRRLQDYLISQKLLSKKVAYLFQTRRGRPLTTRRIFQIVRFYCKRSDVSDNPSPQLIKYAHIVHAYLNDIPISDIEKHVGIAKQRLVQIFEKIEHEQDDDKYASFFRKIDESQKRFFEMKKKR